MYQPGDYVVGYPNYYENDGKRYKTKGGRIAYCENKWSLIAQMNRANGYNVSWPLVDTTTGELDQNGEKVIPYSMDYNKIQGMVVETDNLNSERPHWDGLVRVLCGEKTIWVWSKNVRLVRYAGTKL